MNDVIIKVEKLTKKFGDFTACNEISFSVNRGEIFGFLGANGAGKTTAIKMLCGLSLPTSGEAEIAGFDIYNETQKIKLNISMNQRTVLYDKIQCSKN